MQKNIKKLIKLFDERLRDGGNSSDLALYYLLERWKKQLPPLNYYFHKAFRQIDVTDDGFTDMVIWHLLSTSELFWELFEMLREDKNENN